MKSIELPLVCFAKRKLVSYALQLINQVLYKTYSGLKTAVVFSEVQKCRTSIM